MVRGLFVVVIEFAVIIIIVVGMITINIPNLTFLVRLGGISGEFGRTMVRILARRSRAKIPMVRPNETKYCSKPVENWNQSATLVTREYESNRDCLKLAG